MNKKISIFLLILTVLHASFVMTAYAAKSTAQKVIEDKESSLVLATISDVNDEYITCEVFDRVKRPAANTGDKNTTLNNSISNTQINIKKFKYSYCEEHADSYNTPKIGDNIFVSVRSDGDTYKMSGCAYKVDTVDVKTLNFLVPSPMKGQSCVYDVTAIAYFVAANGMPMEFKFEENAISIKHMDETVQIYPQAEGEMPMKYIDAAGKVVSGAVEAKDVINYDPTMPPTGANLALTQLSTADSAWILSLLIIAAGVIVGLLVAIIVRSGKNKKKRKGI